MEMPGREAKIQMDMNYYQTLIAVAEDCPVTESVVPVKPGAKVTILRAFRSKRA